MPKWGLSMQLGKITAGIVAEGDDVSAGDDLADIETEKIAGTPVPCGASSRGWGKTSRSAAPSR
jgi:Biotin-requiring enzyme